MTVHAPFRFAPIHRWVWFPDWGPLVSHDVPFKDGLSGEIAIEITAETPLLIGGARRKANNDREGEVRPFRLPDGRYAIPGSALQGMIRSILECVAFGRLGPFIDARRFGFRDISNSRTGREYYRTRMITTAGGPPPRTVTQHARAGWLIKGNDGAHRIVTCLDFARMRYDQVRLLTGRTRPDPGNVMERATDAEDRYTWFLGPGVTSKAGLNRQVHLEAAAPHFHAGGNVRITYRRARAAAFTGGTPIEGTLVLTGKTQDGIGPGDKKFEFVFHSPDRAHAAAAPRALPVEEAVWKDFAYIHNHDRLTGRKENPNWEYWRSAYDAGEPVPVFFLFEHGRVSTFGTAFMFKAALPLSTHDLLKNSAEHHLLDGTTDRESRKKLDLPSLIFGFAADTSEDAGPPGLKRRASFDTAMTTARPEHGELQPHRVTLLEPKPSYFPSYVRQPGNQTTGTLDSADKPFAIYYASPKLAEREERVSPELAGTKIWPARNRVAAEDAAGEAAVQSNLRVLPRQTTFETRLRVHNLRPAELGALLWALTFGKAAAWSPGEPIILRHRIGMGKPYGFGEITVRLKQIELRDIGGNATTVGVQGYISKFIESIEREAEAQRVRTTANKKLDWANTVQVKTVLKAANSTLGEAADTVVPEHSPLRQFDYMRLQIGHGGHNHFQDAKRQNAHQNGGFLPRYADGEEMRRAGVAAPAPVSPPRGAAGTPMYDIDEGVEVTFLGPASRNGFGRVDYGDGEGPVEVRLTRLRPL